MTEEEAIKRISDVMENYNSAQWNIEKQSVINVINDILHVYREGESD